MTKIRVLVVEDSLTVRRRLVATLTGDADCQVVGEAGDAQRAMEMCEQLRPDVVTLDMMLPNGTGVDVTEHIMAYTPTPIVIVSASVNRGELLHTYDALAAGALDVIDKPRGTEAPGEWENKLVNTVKMASRIRVITHPRGRLKKATVSSMAAVAPPATPVVQRSTQSVRNAQPIISNTQPVAAGGKFALIAIGASTGGPGAIVQLLSALNPPIPLPILLVIHIGQPFGTALSDWLASTLPLPVMEAKHGELIPPAGTGCVIVAPADRHLSISGGRICLDDGPERYSCRPAVDVLFESVAREMGSRGIGVLLTGMGRDGATGLLAMKQAGAMTLVQDESTSVVFGMPREAVRLGAARRILPLPEIGNALMGLALKQPG